MQEGEPGPRPLGPRRGGVQFAGVFFSSPIYLVKNRGSGRPCNPRRRYRPCGAGPSRHHTHVLPPQSPGHPRVHVLILLSPNIMPSDDDQLEPCAPRPSASSTRAPVEGPARRVHAGARDLEPAAARVARPSAEATTVSAPQRVEMAEKKNAPCRAPGPAPTGSITAAIIQHTTVRCRQTGPRRYGAEGARSRR